MFYFFKATLYLIVFLLCQDVVAKFDNNFIVDYFLSKRASSVLAYHCNEAVDTVPLIRQFSESQIKSVFQRLEMTTKDEWWACLDSINLKVGIVVDLQRQILEGFQALLDKASNNRMFNERFVWLVIGSDYNEILNIINGISFGLSTDFVIAVKKKYGYTLYDVYKTCDQCETIQNVKLIGTWNSEYGFDYTPKQSKSYRWNLHGSTLKISGLISSRPENTTLMEFLNDYNKFRQLEPTAKLAYALWVALSEMYNFTIAYQEKAVWKKGDKNGPVMNALLTGEVIATGTPLTITHERIRHANPVYAAIPFRSCFFFRSIASSHFNYQIILEPFSSDVWHYIIVFGTVSINVIVFISIFQDSKLSDKYVDAIILNIGAFCQQGVDFKNDHLSGRIAVLFIFIFNLLLNNYYMASLVTSRLRSYHSKVNDSLNQLTKLNLDIAAEKSLYFDFYMKRNDWETKLFYTNVWSKLPDHKKFLDPNSAMTVVAKGGLAYHTLPETAYPHIAQFFDDRKICEMAEVHLVRPTQLSIFVSKNSSMAEMMKCGFAKLTEQGIRNREIRRWLARKPNCRTDVLTTENVTFEETAPLIIFIFLSIVVSIALLIVEKLYYGKFLNQMQLLNRFIIKILRV